MQKNLFPGTFIVFEGLDGSGQTTQAKLLEDYLKKAGRKVLATKEPTAESEAGKRIERILGRRESASPTELQSLFAEDRREHVNTVIIPALKRDEIVISDRYFFSSFAFGSLGCDLEWLISLNKDFLLPDATFILMVRPETAVQRIAKRGLEKTLFEKVETLRRVLDNYKKLAERFENLFYIDGEETIEKVHTDIAEKMKKILERPSGASASGSL